MNKPQEWNDLMKPFRDKRLFCTSVKERLNPNFSKVDIISGLMEAGYDEYEANHFYNVIEEKKKGGLRERNGDE
mgnify:CR=1 FL=1